MINVEHISSRVNKILQKLKDEENNISPDHITLVEELQQISQNETTLAYALYFNARIKQQSGNIKDAVTDYEKALNLFVNQNLLEPQVDVLNWLGWCVGFFSGNYYAGVQYLNKANSLATQIDYKRGIAIALNNLGAINHAQGENNQALNHCLQSLKIWEELADEYGLGLVYNSIGIIYYEQGNFTLSLENHLKSLNLREGCGDRRGVAASYQNIGNIYDEQGKYKKALEYHIKSLKIQEEIGNKLGMAVSYQNIGIIYKNIKKYHQSLNYYLEGQKIWEETGNKFGISAGYINISGTYLSLKKHDKAEEYAVKALEYSNKIKSSTLIIYSRISLASAWIETKKYRKAAKHLVRTFILAEESGEKPKQKEILEKLYNCYKLIGDTAKALEYHELFVKLKDEIFNEETTRKISGLQISHELQQQQKVSEMERLKNVELKKAYDDLKAAQDELIRKERMAAIGKIASEIAHEVQNPLNFVNNFSEVNVELSEELKEILDSNKLNDDEREAIRNLINNSLTINQHGRRAAGIVSQLLELTRKGESF